MKKVGAIQMIYLGIGSLVPFIPRASTAAGLPFVWTDWLVAYKRKV